jgi:hypothetical protein
MQSILATSYYLDAKLQNIPHTSKQKVLASLACHYYKTQNQKEG